MEITYTLKIFQHYNRNKLNGVSFVNILVYLEFPKANAGDKNKTTSTLCPKYINSFVDSNRKEVGLKSSNTSAALEGHNVINIK